MNDDEDIHGEEGIPGLADDEEIIITADFSRTEMSDEEALKILFGEGSLN
jgi:hypothetical protein